MSDPLEVLSLPNVSLEPSPEFRARVMQMLGEELEQIHGSASPHPAASSPPMVLESTGDDPPDERRRLRHFTLIVAAAAAVVAVTAMIVVQDRDTAPPPVNEQPPEPAISTGPAGSTARPAPPATTVAFDPVRDTALSEAMLLDASEYAPGWMIVDFNEIVLDRLRADDVPGCTVFLDTVFENPDRQAVTSYRSFLDASVPAVMSQYVVVFPSADDAKAMFEATVDPTFHDQCFQPYFDLARSTDGEWCCDTEETGMPALWGQPVESDADLGADDMAFRVDNEQFWTDDTGVEHGPESVRSVTVRVGRAVMIMETLSLDEHGKQIVTDDQFNSAIAAAVERARTALDDSD